MDFGLLWYKIKRKAKRIYKKIKKWFKRYVRLLVRHTKAKDYSVLMYTIFVLLAIILMFVLVGKLFSSFEDDKKKTTEKTTTEISTPVDATYDPELEKQKALSEQAKKIYEANKDLLILVNVSNPMQSDYTFEHHTLNCGKDIDKRALEDLKALLNACNEAGHEYQIVSAYRDKIYQDSLLEQTETTYINQGMTAEEAHNLAIQSVQPGGCSEHQLGLALDLSSLGVSSLEEYLDSDPVNIWFIENSYKYGFILRYPSDKVEFTGITYEPWHFRYVGIEAAKFMHDNNICLEEFHILLNTQY